MFPTSVSREMETETNCSHPRVISQDFIHTAKSLSTTANDFLPCLQISPEHSLGYCKSCNFRGELWTCKSQLAGFTYHSLGNASSYSHGADNLLASPISLIPSGLQSNLCSLRVNRLREMRGKQRRQLGDCWAAGRPESEQQSIYTCTALLTAWELALLCPEDTHVPPSPLAQPASPRNEFPPLR